MKKQIFLNLPVADLPRSVAFFKALGFSSNPQFTDDTAACVVVSDTISVMLATHAKFRQFTPKAICDTTRAVEVLLSLSCESRQEVDDLVAKAIAAGGLHLRQGRGLWIHVHAQLCRPRRPRVGTPAHERAAAGSMISRKAGPNQRRD